MLDLAIDPQELLVDQSLVLTVIGLDRPGIVERVAQTVAEHGGNWVESRMAKLAGRFAGVVRVDVPAGELQSLKAALNRLEAEGLMLSLQPATEADAGVEHEQTVEINLSYVGHDREGLVREVSHALANAGVNVLELTTRVYSAPMSGELLFEALTRLAVPVNVDLPTLRETLNELGHRLDLDMTFGQEETPDAPGAL